jgi:hypothetical protein
MAFSQNQRQLRAWGDLFEIPAPDSDLEIPQASLKFWARANKKVADLGKSLGKERYLQINFDLLCQKPTQIIDDIIAFLNIEIDTKQYQTAANLPLAPESIGRYKNHDLNQFDPDDLKIVKSFGFSIAQG